MTNRIYYTYAYLREDGTPYYIGRGKDGRAYAAHKISKPPRERILFLKQELTYSESIDHEKYMIFVLGRKDLGTGILRNLTDGGEGVENLAPETRKRISEKRMGQVNRSGPHTPESRLKMSRSHKGKMLTEEHKANIGKAVRKRIVKEETKQKLREARAKQKPPTLGKKHSEETKLRMAEAARQRWARERNA